MEIIELAKEKPKPEFTFKTARTSGKTIFETNDLVIGYDNPLTKPLNLYMERGQKIALVGANGLGKSTLLKTLVGLVSPLSGSYIIGNNVKIGYFDQQMAQYTSNKTVMDDFHDEFPALSDYEVRSALGAFLFSGDDVFKSVDVLSGGEKVRLALCKIFKRKPNFLILDEPTNHMDIIGKEALEDMLSQFSGTLLFVSHDRYFVKKVAHHILSFEGKDSVKWFEFGFNEFEEYQQRKETFEKDTIPSPSSKKSSKANYTTPAKERSKCERALKKAEEQVNALEILLDRLNSDLLLEENLSDYVKLSQIQAELAETEEKLRIAMENWEAAENALSKLI